MAEKDIRYSRLEMLEGIGPSGISKLNSSKVLVVGCGALGSLCAMYLAVSGVGHLAIADFDTVDLSNLQRQLFFDEKSLGLLKTNVLADRIRAINSTIEVNELQEMITPEKAINLFADFDFVIDASDNPATKNMTASVCERLDVPYCIGGVREYSGQVMSWAPGHKGYGELFGDVPRCSGFTPCSLAGVLGPAAGVVASVQAAEAIKNITGVGNMLHDKLFTFDLFSAAANVFSF